MSKHSIQSNSESTSIKIDNARVKLLTLLNVTAAKPTKSLSKSQTPIQRDWNSIARSSISKSITHQTHSINQISLESTSTGILESSNQETLVEDFYSNHFGAETSLLNSTRIELSKDWKNWKLTSNSKLDEKRIIRYSINSPIPHQLDSSSKPIPKIVKTRNQWIENLTSHQTQVFESLKTYQDLWFTNLPYNQSRVDFRISIALWTLEHVKETRRQVLKNDKHLARIAQQNITPVSTVQDPNDSTTQTKPTPEMIEPDLRDQGFTRPKVLILLPFRSSAYDWVTKLIKYTTSPNPSKESIPKGFDRFEKEYTLPKGTEDKLETDEAREKYTLEHRMIFAGNVDDDFKLGIQLTSNPTQLKLYSNFFQSDWIIGSPVGLRKLIEKEGDADFLSSIEMVIADQMDVMLMQNWDHVEFLFDHLNQIPSKPRDTDFSRVKPWYLDDHAKHLRQTILLSSLSSPEQTSLFRRLTNQSGKSIEFYQANLIRSGILWKLKPGLQQTWLKFKFDEDLQEEEEMRLKVFKEKLLIPLLASAMVKSGLGGIMIFVTDYFEFVKLEEYMRTLDEIKFVSISEYSTPSEINAARSAFFNQHVSFLIVTERFHFYHRYKLRGAKEILFYSPPIHSDYYLEFCNEYPFEKGRVDVEEVKVKVLFSDLDSNRIERIVGLDGCRKMVKGDGMKFTFV
ncbi:uncharacterized protein MELLADRAFT_115881 [Melampsora larici-populina 98AG31]|uniref:U3 small nucleolar RNA-associated protein 25 n=1 Tax=Melampsora larici-populina (strain 98AG31 / pathotype 3-4-7) TaxID=747676 RepID=F4RFB5_MELLP|nr:uncharacterized protein MELLADRAFT_115881 [Melampsora larici-populina 98AG31]EGG08964.1 hypothetical protein MELLADRAFT_115881 [Melampsora larici-populina 98AG31]